jgi:hypothetical protein
MSETWLTKREIAAHYRVSTRTVERLGWPFRRVGGQNRYYVSWVERYLQGRGSHDGHVEDNVVELRPRSVA